MSQQANRMGASRGISGADYQNLDNGNNINDDMSPSSNFLELENEQ